MRSRADPPRPASAGAIGFVCGLACALAACSGEARNDPIAPAFPPPNACDGLGWDNAGAVLLTTWCASCHSSHRTGSDRLGAPPGIDLDTLQGAQAVGSDALIAAVGPGGTMPPSRGMGEADRDRLIAWAACGMPEGEGDSADVAAVPAADTPPLSCAAPAIWPDDALVGGSSTAARALCTTHNAVAGDLIVEGDVDLPCLCAIDGALRIASSGATTVRLPELDRVGGAVEITDNPFLRHVAISDLRDVGGPLLVADNPDLVEVEAWRLHATGGAVTIARNASLADLSALSALQSVAGSLTIEANDALAQIDGLTRIESLAGDLSIRDNASLRGLHGFFFATHLPGALTIADNPELRRVTAFADLVAVDGAISLSGQPLLAEGPDLPWLVSAGGLSLDGTAHAGLPLLGELRTLDGDLILRECDALVDLTAMDSLALVTGDVRITGNDDLPSAQIDDLLADTVVQGDLDRQ